MLAFSLVTIVTSDLLLIITIVWLWKKRLDRIEEKLDNTTMGLNRLHGQLKRYLGEY